MSNRDVEESSKQYSLLARFLNCAKLEAISVISAFEIQSAALAELMNDENTRRLIKSRIEKSILTPYPLSLEDRTMLTKN